VDLKDLILLGTAVATLSAAITYLAKGARWMRQRLRRLDRFLEDWFGDPGADDERRLGVMARLRQVERRLARVEGQLKPNGGSTVMDAVMRIEQAVTPEQGENTIGDR
jgi:hypothetical protein